MIISQPIHNISHSSSGIISITIFLGYHLSLPHSTIPRTRSNYFTTSSNLSSRLANEDASMQEEQLSSAVQSLLVAGGVLSEANKKLQESSRLLSEEEGHVCLRNLQTMLRVRQQYMTSQISMLYPVKISVGPAQEQELEAYPAGSLAETSAGRKPNNQLIKDP